MNNEELKKYLLLLAKEGYATGDEKAWKKEDDNSTTITHSNGDFQTHDNFFGGEPYGGREVVFYKNKAEWIMVYFGTVGQKVTDIKNVYAFLQKALALAPSEMPVRGPKDFSEGAYTYTNAWVGSIEEFSGEERIMRNGEEVYKAHYMGGLVDQREE